MASKRDFQVRVVVRVILASKRDFQVRVVVGAISRDHGEKGSGLASKRVLLGRVLGGAVSIRRVARSGWN